ncbi:DUF397 domain-containing protein [Spongiactinospora sp. TRM90649]|uniref:DUF397 domain-containing protein n=1 Tax=Spongiactinospora sp. TRM90649 TaxID=3031114 RepID=UPI0023F96F60|nr:DUF397 domain-containing protein [Spongiactinospora sp. TRM90649]MDF5758811.1 DUF397 domain-containing protein [Spongiactinospora sp. TRM90649]
MDLTQSEELTWRKSSYSGANSSDCVEIATLPEGGRAVRDSKDSGGPILRFAPSEWRAFVDGIKDGTHAPKLQ